MVALSDIYRRQLTWARVRIYGDAIPHLVLRLAIQWENLAFMAACLSLGIRGPTVVTLRLVQAFLRLCRAHLQSHQRAIQRLQRPITF